MQNTSDAEVGHIPTNLMSSNPSVNRLTPYASGSTTRIIPLSTQRHPQSISPIGNKNQSSLKRSRSRPAKSCEECRRKKLKCDRELPCSNCKKGGRDGSACVFKDGFGERKRRSSSMNQSQDSPIDRYPSVPKFARTDPIGPGRGILAYGLTDFAPLRGSDPERDWRNRVPSLTPVSMEGLGRETGLDHGNGNGPVKGILAHGETDYADSRAPDRIWRNEEPRLASWVQVRGEIGDQSARALGRVHVKGTRSRYVGIGDRMAILNHFEDSKNFIVGSVKNPETSDVFRELTAYQNAFQSNRKFDHVIPHDREELMVEMMKAIPSGFLFGILQAKYISNWETIWRVLHIGTFMKECDQVTQIRDSGLLTLPPQIRGSVLPQILSILSIASRLDDPDDRGSTTERLLEAKISRNCQLVQAWLDGLHGKALVDLHTLRTKTLLLIARQANLATPSELWVESGNLVRNAMIMGLHQDPEPWDEISKFDKEMRRKLWLTIVELDLQFSLSAGMPSALTANSFNMRELINVDDHDLTEELTEYPPSKPPTVWTHALPQIALTASLKARLDIINTLGGNLNLALSAPTLLQQAATLESALLSLPTQFRSSTRAGNTSNKRLYRLFTSVILDVSIRRPLMTLYRTISMSSLSSRYPEARQGALRSALAILSHLDALDPLVADLNIVKSREYLNLFHILRKNDILQAALILCFEIQCYNSPSSNHSSSENLDSNQSDDDHFPQNQYSLTRVVENTLNSLLGRLGEFGSDLKDVLPVSVALQAVRSDGTEAEKRELMVRGAERVLGACRRARPDVRVDGNAGHGNSSQNAHNGGWNGVTQNGSVEQHNRFDVIPDDDLSFDTIDFGFLDWEFS